jgi:hypothetical protein
MSISKRLFAIPMVLLLAMLAACGEGSAAEVTATVTAPAVVATAAPTPAPTEAPTPEPTPTAVATRVPTPVPAPVRPIGPPTAGRWIDVDVTRFMVRLMDGTRPVREIGPVGVGREIDTGRYESTQTGLFAVYTKRAERTYDAPYDTYIAWWVGFDPAKDNGFHSFLQDEQGNTVDASTGRVSNGCIRSGQAAAIYEYAEIGMPVWVHA